jgi:diacylglycerol kinase (ATP)
MGDAHVTERAMLLVNPASGRGTAARLAGMVAARLRDVVDRLDVHVATDAADTADTARRAVDGGCGLLAVMGGDGSAHLAIQSCAGSETTLAVIPAGTGNDMAAALGMPDDPLAAAEEVAAAIGRGDRPDPFDLGRVDGGGWFSTVLCAGFDSKVNERANLIRWPHGPARYNLAIFVELVRLGASPLTVQTENGTHELTATMVSVGNTPTYGGGLPICPAADLHDGLLDVTVVGPISRRRLVRMLPLLRTGAHVHEPEVLTLRARQVRLSGDNGWVAYADGDRQETLPVVISCVPDAVRVLTARSEQV